MRVKLFTFRFSPTLGAFDDSALLAFVRDKEVLAFREHFFVVSDMPHLACVVTYQDAVVPIEALDEARAVAAVRRDSAAATPPWPGTARRTGDQRLDPLAGLDEAARALFNTLREWRSQTARREGVPPYVIFSNRELVRVVVARPESTTALGHLDGVGPGKVERYGAAILRCLHGPPLAVPAPAAPAAVELRTGDDLAVGSEATP